MENDLKTKLDTRRIGIFLGLSFGVAWLTALVIFLTGGLANSPRIGGILSLALILMAVPYMWAPAVANVLTRLLTREGWRDTGIRPHFQKGWPYWLMAWVLPALMTIFGAILFFALFPGFFDPSLSFIQKSLMGAPVPAFLSPWMIAAIEAVAGILISPIVNGWATFGEEFGWRAYLLPKLMPLGWRKAMLWMGLIWGVWHWPLIFMGYEYGFQYPGSPWLGPILFLWITFCFGVFLSWVDSALGKYLAGSNRPCCDQRDCIPIRLSHEGYAGSIAWTASGWDHRLVGLCSDRTDLVPLARF